MSNSSRRRGNRPVSETHLIKHTPSIICNYSLLFRAWLRYADDRLIGDCSGRRCSVIPYLDPNFSRGGPLQAAKGDCNTAAHGDLDLVIA